MRRRASRGAIKTFVDGIKFDSKLEAQRYGQLKLLEMAGEISLRQRQPIYEMVVNGHLICKYIPDFLYIEVKTGQLVAEDAKGFLEVHTRLKIKLAKALHPDVDFRLWPERKRKVRAGRGENN